MGKGVYTRGERTAVDVSHPSLPDLGAHNLKKFDNSFLIPSSYRKAKYYNKIFLTKDTVPASCRLPEMSSESDCRGEDRAIEPQERFEIHTFSV